MGSHVLRTKNIHCALRIGAFPFSERIRRARIVLRVFLSRFTVRMRRVHRALFGSHALRTRSNYRIPVHKDTRLTQTGPRSRSQIAKTLKEEYHRGPQSRSEILYNNEDITGTATAVRSPVVKYCIIMRTLQGLPPRSAVP